MQNRLHGHHSFTFVVSAVLQQNAFEATSPFTDAWRLRDFPPGVAAYQVFNKHNVSCCSGRPGRRLYSQSAKDYQNRPTYV